MLVNSFAIFFLILLILLLGTIAIQFIRLEKKLEETVEVLEEELIDVFGTQPGESLASAAGPAVSAGAAAAALSTMAKAPPAAAKGDAGKKPSGNKPSGGKSAPAKGGGGKGRK